MTRLFIHATDPNLAIRIRPDVYRKMVEKREYLRGILAESLNGIQRITLEIGCGHGHFLAAYGQRFGGEFCVGLDVNRGRILKARKKVDRAGLKNVLCLDCEGLNFLSLLPRHVRVEKTWILYPDPWPKKRHFKNRIIQLPFLENLAGVSLPGSRLHLRSDHHSFMDWSRHQIQNSPCWKLVDDFDWPELTTTVFQELTSNRHTSLVAELQPAEEPHQHKLPQDGDK